MKSIHYVYIVALILVTTVGGYWLGRTSSDEIKLKILLLKLQMLNQKFCIGAHPWIRPRYTMLRANQA